MSSLIASSATVLPPCGPTALKSCISPPLASQSRTKRASSRRASTMTVRCDVASKTADSVNAEETELSEEEMEAKAKVGSSIRVTAPLKVYHVNRVPEVDLEGMEGKLKDYVAVWKGKRISANLPYKVLQRKSFVLKSSISIRGRVVSRSKGSLRNSRAQIKRLLGEQASRE